MSNYKMKSGLRCAFAVLLLLMLCSVMAACKTGKEAAVIAEATQAPTPTPQVITLTVSVTPTPTPAPALTPTPSPTPLPTIAINDDWYAARNRTLSDMLVKNGGYTPEQANVRVLYMQIDPNKPMVALTFDDGPTRKITDHVLDVLETYNARATFFVVGQRIEGCEDLLRRMTTLGCEIGSHTWGHGDLTVLSEKEGIASVQKSVDAIRDACGYEVRSLRPPKGNANGEVKAYAGDMGLSLIYWNHSTHDFRLDSARKVERNVFHDVETDKEIADGDIVLLHDLREPTGDAIENIVRRLTEEGYQLVTVQELLYCSDMGFAPGESYSSQTEH